MLVEMIRRALMERPADHENTTLILGPLEEDGSLGLELKIGPTRYLTAADSLSDADLEDGILHLILAQQTIVRKVDVRKE